ncbi:lytic transglycosylase domain-containing protein [Candidatus Solirubrobacter pratensis]|uniref:lytic transglycosylase domain-containing protein n=1 Tax=Candidatus Solirubrobacter pratensis TaxID=1298857 RepID=UPI00040EF658|nr:lytic transglycosylase domain-containing protein [Candidatus Solirubrobacter pratensis]
MPDIPADYLNAYKTAAVRYELGEHGWSYLAAIGKIESDHGRSTAPGVHAGQNAYGCCAGPMQIHNGFGSGGGTWGAYRVDGNDDGREDIYDPADAVATAARYLVASGAPNDWRRAIFAYNHADWYVDQVLQQAAVYRDSSGPSTMPVVAGEGWLVAVPGSNGERCDARIVPDVLALLSRFGLRLSACYGGAPHATDGEHPLGLATDLVPVDGDWGRTLTAARAFGWSPECAAAGCPGRGPFRVVLYNGYPGHGDPAHTSTPHLHLSWQHALAEPFTRARWVRVLIPPDSPR